jgi:hypothetical protein
MRYRHPLTDRLFVLACAAGVAGAAACGPLHRGGTPPAYLYFTNESLDQADVYASVGGNQPIRIGTVMAGKTDTLKVPPDIAARGENVNVIARVLAHSGAVASGPVPIHPGDRLSVRLPIDQKLLVVLPGS